MRSSACKHLRVSRILLCLIHVFANVAKPDRYGAAAHNLGRINAVRDWRAESTTQRSRPYRALRACEHATDLRVSPRFRPDRGPMVRRRRVITCTWHDLRMAHTPTGCSVTTRNRVRLGTHLRSPARNWVTSETDIQRAESFWSSHVDSRPEQRRTTAHS